jgi:uncharacterized coiled-coil DUF342 family protein
MGFHKEVIMEVCSEHGKLMEAIGRIEQRLDDGGKNMECLHKMCIEHTTNIAEVKKIVTNGLQSDISDMKKSLQALEGFNWFRETVQKMRDRLFWSTVKGICLVVIFMVLFHLTDKATMTLVKEMLK